MLAPLLGLPRQSEILIIIFLGICFLSLDFSLFEIKSNLEEVWTLQLNKAKYLETVLKYLISAVVLARTFTLHVFLACYIVMLWPAIFEEKPNLMLPWLFLGIFRCLILNAITLTVGIYICNKEKGLSPICLEYVVAQVIEHGPSVYAWLSVLGFYRNLVGEHDSAQSSAESLLSGTEESIENQGSEEKQNISLDKSKSYSLSDLNLDYMHSSRFRTLSVDMPMDVLLEELTHLVAKTRIIQDSSKSSNSLHQDKNDDSLEIFETLSTKDLTIIEKTMKILDVSEQDVLDARQEKYKLIEILKEVSVEDVNKIDEKARSRVTSPSFYIRKGKTRRGIKSHVPKSLSLPDEAQSRDSCLCYLRRKLQQEQSKLTLVESEIANIKFDEADKDTDTLNTRAKAQSDPISSEANCKSFGFTKSFIKNDIPNNLNRCRVVVGASLGFNTNILLQKFALKKNASKNFGCQVSLLKESFLVGSRNELAKNLNFLRNFRLL